MTTITHYRQLLQERSPLAIGRYLLTLSESDEDTLLTTPLSPAWLGDGGHHCMVVTVWRPRDGCEHIDWGSDALPAVAGMVYEAATFRFGTTRVNTAIRHRILRNRARRAALFERAAELFGVTA